MTTQTNSEQQYLHLVRLAWDLRWAGSTVSVELPCDGEPFVQVARAVGPLRVRASVRGQHWVFTWGRGRNQWAYALDADAARQIRAVLR